MELASSIRSAKLPPFNYILNNGMLVAQAFFVLISPFIPLVGGNPIQDRSMDILFAGYLCLIVVKCLSDGPSFRLVAGLAIVFAYGAAGLIEALMISNLNGFNFEAKLLVSVALFFCLLDQRPKLSDFSVKLLFSAFILGSLIFLAINPGDRLHLVNESNYLCMYIGIAMFSYLSFKGKQIKIRTLIGLGVFTVFLMVVTQSRTGAAFLALTWIVYLFERYGFQVAVLASIGLGVVGVIGVVVAVMLNLSIVKRFEELKNPSRVDRFIYAVEVGKIIEKRSIQDNLIRLSYAQAVQNRVNNNMKWLTEKGRHGTESGQLYPHHFHLAYLRILVGHGFLVLFAYLISIPLVWRVNKYLAIGLLVCSLSMSVPYLSLFFGALHLAMAFPNRSWVRRDELPENQPAKSVKLHMRRSFT